jgi:DNA-binding CsgD family transcriptional regulator/tetratricopeptide (TPR) repeat protein
MHWSDTATLAVLVQLVRRQPVLLATRDTGDRAGQVLDTLTGAGATLVELVGLGDGAAAALVERRRPELPTEAREAIVRRAEGNPLRLVEAIAGPNPTLEARVAAALRGLQPAVRDDLTRLALLGRPADDHLLGSSLAELVESGLVLVDGETVELRHDLIGDEVLAAASEDEIREHHRFLAVRLPAAESAHHHAAAGSPAAARSAAIEAADRTEHPGEKARLLVLAATCLPPGADADSEEQADLLLRAVDAFTESGELDDARSTMEQLSAMQESAAVLLRTARLEWRQGHPEAARAAVDAGLALAAGSETPEEVALRIEQLRFPIRVDFDAARAVELGRSTVALACRLGCEEARARTLLGSALLIDGSSEWSKQISLGMELAARTSDIDAEMEAANAMTAAHLLGGDRVEAREVATRAWQAARSANRRAWEEQFGVLANFLALIAGDLPAVTEWGRREVGPHLNAAIHLAFGTYAIALADVGRQSVALSTIRDGLALEVGDATGPSLLHWAEAEAHWLLGQTAPALAAAEKSLSCAVPGFPVRPLAAAIRAWCQYDSGRPVTEAEEDGWDFAQAAAVESRGVALLAANEPTEAARQFGAAAELAADAPRFALRARWALGESWRLAGEPEPALAVLRAAHDDAARAGFMALHGRCHRSLRQLGSPEHIDDREGMDGPPLTGRQREVLRLVARGHTTREIASILGVRPATVDTHVSDAMRRLGAVTRLQAALLVEGRLDESSDRPGSS